MAKKMRKSPKTKNSKVGTALLKGLQEAVKTKDVKPKNGKIKLGKISLTSRTRVGPPVFTVKRTDLVGKTYPFKIKETVVAQDKSYGKTLEKFAKYLETAKAGAYCYELKDNEYKIYEYYSAVGALEHRMSPVEDKAPYAGNPAPKYAESEVVEVRDYDELRLAVIMACPVSPEEAVRRNIKLDSSDNVYLVDFSMDTSEHSHPRESHIKKLSFPVTDKQKEEMKQIYKELKSTVV